MKLTSVLIAVFLAGCATQIPSGKQTVVTNSFGNPVTGRDWNCEACYPESKGGDAPDSNSSK